jgi:carboxyl-terminal processing protease
LAAGHKTPADPLWGCLLPKRCIFKDCNLMPAYMLGLILGLGLILAPVPFCAAQNGNKAAFPGGQLMRQALDLIGARALNPAPPAWKARAALRVYVRGLDRYSDYLNPAEYTAFTNQRLKNYAGVGMDIMPDKEGALICFPLQHGPAHRAGVRSRDILLAVDGRTVNGQSTYVVSGWITGQTGSKVNLTLQRQTQRVVLDIARADLVRHTVKLTQAPDRPALIRISRFKPGTLAELKQALAQCGDSSGLVLDLRGNPGGDFWEMLKVADLFVEPNTPLLQIKSRKGSKSFKAKLPAEVKLKPLAVWQDGATASAAEALTMILTYHKLAASLGWHSFGKGSMQRVHKLPDGSALILTSGLILNPAGKTYHGRGLKPEHPLPPCNEACTRALWQKTLEVFGDAARQPVKQTGAISQGGPGVKAAKPISAPEPTRSGNAATDQGGRINRP